MSNEQKEYRKLLIEEANEFGLEFKPNIPTTKLQAMVDQAQGATIGISPPTGEDDNIEEETGPVAQKAEVEVDIDPEEVDTPEVLNRAQALHLKKRQKIAQARRRAMKTKIVIITNRDARDTEVTSTANLAFENQYFSFGKQVPLDIPVELEVSLIDIAENVMMPTHKDEIKDGKRTGLKVTVMAKKYAVSYPDPAQFKTDAE